MGDYKLFLKEITEKIRNSQYEAMRTLNTALIRLYWNMRNFYVIYQADEKLQPMVAEISWTKNLVIMEKRKEDLKREFYIQMTKRYGWTKDILIKPILMKQFQNNIESRPNWQ